MDNSDRGHKPEANRSPKWYNQFKRQDKNNSQKQSDDSISIPYNAQHTLNGTGSKFVEHAFEKPNAPLGNARVKVMTTQYLKGLKGEGAIPEDTGKRATVVIPKDEETARILWENAHARTASADGKVSYDNLIRNQTNNLKNREHDEIRKK
jgi:hypothetical protein